MKNEDDDAQDRIWLDLTAQGGRHAEQAFEALFRKYRGPLLGFLVRRGADPADAEDLVQEAFLRASRAAAAFRRESRVSSWLFQIARNLQVDKSRKHSAEDTFDDVQWQFVEAGVAAANEAEIAQACAAEDLQACVEGALRQYAEAFPDRAEVLALVERQHWAVRDVAAFIGRNEGATREYLSQCRKKLKVFLEPCRRFLSEV